MRENSAEKFLGDWKLAAAETQGVTMIGDFSQGILGEAISMTVSIAKNGTGTVTFNDETANMTWKLTGDNAISITPLDEPEDNDQIIAKLDDGILSIEMSDVDFNGSLMLSKDGKIPGIEPVSLANAKDVANANEVVGTWNLTGMNFGGLSMFGDAAALSSVMGGSVDSTVTIGADGTANAFGETVNWIVGSSGASLDLGSGIMAPMKQLDGKLVVDASTIMGGIEFAMIYSK